MRVAPRVQCTSAKAPRSRGDRFDMCCCALNVAVIALGFDSRTLSPLTIKNSASIYAISARPRSGLPKFIIVGVLLLFAVVYVGSLFSPGLQDDADSTHAEAAREMLVTHDYVTLKVNGNRYLEKAPLMYWVVALCYFCFGVNEFAAHLPVALSMLLLVLLAMRWGRRAFGDRAAIYAGIVRCDGRRLLSLHAHSDSGIHS